jgi:hypothetical protein
MGVSPFALFVGGGGLANGFGGPEAPALNNALADGEGGGSTTAECGASALAFAGVMSAVLGSLGEEVSAVPLPLSELLLGI